MKQNTLNVGSYELCRSFETCDNGCNLHPVDIYWGREKGSSEWRKLSSISDDTDVRDGMIFYRPGFTTLEFRVGEFLEKLNIGQMTGQKWSGGTLFGFVLNEGILKSMPMKDGIDDLYDEEDFENLF